MIRVSILLRCLVLLLALLMLDCSGSTKTTVVIPPPSSGSDLVYTANSAGSPATVSAFTADRKNGSLTAITGSPFNAGTGSYALAATPGATFLYVANYFSSDISAFAIDNSKGTLTAVSGSPFAAELGVDSLALDPAGQFLYVVTERSENLWAYSISSNGSLTAVSGFPTTIAPPGSSSHQVFMDSTGKYLYITNTASSQSHGSIFGFSRDAASGGLTALSGFPISLNGLANLAAFDPSGKFLLVTGTNVFGTVGGIAVFSLDASTGELANATPAVQTGSDPSGVVIDASGKFVYVPNTSDATISAFTLDGSGGLTPIPGSPFASGGHGTINGPMGIATDAAAHYVYAGNASNDISVFSISGTNGALTPVAGSPFPAGASGTQAIIFVKSSS